MVWVDAYSAEFLANQWHARAWVIDDRFDGWYTIFMGIVSIGKETGMSNFDFWNFNANLIITTSIFLIAVSLVYIAFKLFNRDSSRKSSARKA